MAPLDILVALVVVAAAAFAWRKEEAKFAWKLEGWKGFSLIICSFGAH